MGPESECCVVHQFMQTKAKMKAGHGGIESVVDPKLEGNYPREIFVSLVDLGLKCASFKRNIRPTMKVLPSVIQFFFSLGSKRIMPYITCMLSNLLAVLILFGLGRICSLQ